MMFKILIFNLLIITTFVCANAKELTSLYHSTYTKSIKFTSDINTTIEKIERLSVTKHLEDAKFLLAKSLKQYPMNIKLHLLKAKFLYWDNNTTMAKNEIELYKKYDKILYKKIYISWAIAQLKKKKKPTFKIDFIKTLIASAQQSYDIRWEAIQSYIKMKKFKIALKLSKKLYIKYPHSQEVHERFATLLFWNNKFKKSLREYHKLRKKYGNYYKKNIKQLESILLSKKLNNNIVKKTIPTYIKNTRKEIKKRQKQHLYNHMVGVGANRASFSDNRYKDNSQYVEATLPIDIYTLYIKIEKTNRYGTTDIKTSGEFYPKMPNPFWGYLSFSYTFDADFFSSKSIGWHQFYGWKQWQVGFGYEWSKYKTGNIQLLSTEYSYYLTDYTFARQVFYFVPNNKSWALVNQIKYQTPQHLEYYMNYIVSSSNEKEEIYSSLIGTDMRHIEIGGEYPFYASYTTGIKLAKDWYIGKYNQYTRSYLEVTFRYYW